MFDTDSPPLLVLGSSSVGALTRSGALRFLGVFLGLFLGDRFLSCPFLTSRAGGSSSSSASFSIWENICDGSDFSFLKFLKALFSWLSFLSWNDPFLIPRE